MANSTDLRDRWKILQLLGPVFELLNRAGPRADIDHRGYDFAQLACAWSTTSSTTRRAWRARSVSTQLPITSLKPLVG